MTVWPPISLPGKRVLGATEEKQAEERARLEKYIEERRKDV